MGPEAVDIVLLFYVNNFFRGSNSVDRQVVITDIPEDDKSSVNLAQEQVQGDVAIGHGDDGVNGVGITAADQVAEFLRTCEDVRNVVVGVAGDKPVFVRNVAEVADGGAEATEYVRMVNAASKESLPAVTISIAKRKGTNAVE